MVVGVALVAYTHGVPGIRDLQAMMAAAGLWAPALFVGLQAALTVTPVPRTVFTLAAGLLFGSLLGLALTLLATTLAAAFAFWLVRMTGGRLVRRYARGAAVHWARTRLDHHGTLAVASLRLVPLVPFSVLNYLSGLSAVRFVPYVIGTVVGILPGTVAMVVLGDAVTGRPSPVLIAVSVVCGLIGLAGIVVAARRPVPEEIEPDAEPEPAGR
nr:VTT domain-containing protein [Pseudonocardia acidicola]